jgi:hypothetical protein
MGTIIADFKRLSQDSWRGTENGYKKAQINIIGLLVAFFLI